MSDSSKKTGKTCEVVRIHIGSDGEKTASVLDVPEELGDLSPEEIRTMKIMESLLKPIHKKIEDVQKSVGGMEGRIEGMEGRIEGMKEDMVGMEGRIISEMRAGFSFLGKSILETHEISDQKSTHYHYQTVANLGKSKKSSSKEYLDSAEKKVNNSNIDDIIKKEEVFKNNVNEFIENNEKS